MVKTNYITDKLYSKNMRKIFILALAALIAAPVAAAKKKKLLNEAIAPLDKCLTEYPDNPQKQKVEENKKFLEQELGK